MLLIIEDYVTLCIKYLFHNQLIIHQVKGYSQSSLGSLHLPPNLRELYDRVWDEADYVVPPAENGAFFVTTNVVITPNQTLGTCPEVLFQLFFFL